MIIIPPNPQVVISNGNVTFICASLRVFPQHQVSWIFINNSGKSLELIQTQTHDTGNSNKYSIDDRKYGTTRFGALTVINVTYEDQGTYRCNASNEIGYSEASANLTIQGRIMNSYYYNRGR